jgi:hypothetical protein
VLNKQLAALLDAEKEINEKLEELLRSKRIELENTAQFMYRKNNYAPLHKLYLETTEKLVKRRAKLFNSKKLYEDLKREFEEKRTEFAMHKAEQRMRLEETKNQMEELKTILRPDLKNMKTQLDKFNSQIVNDKKRIGTLQEKLHYNVDNVNAIRRTLENTVEQPLVLKQKAPIVEEVSAVKVKKLSPPKEECKRPVNDYIGLMGIGKRNAPRIVYSGANQVESKFKMDLDKCSVKEAQVFECIRSLLEGVTVFKKYKNKSSLKEKVFDPLLAHRYPPEACGFGKRNMIYNPLTTCIEFRALKKPFGVDYAVALLDLKRIIIPNETQQIIKAQAKLSILNSDNERSVELQNEEENSKKAEVQLDRLARTKDNSQFLEQCIGIRLYLFEILSQNSRIEIIAETYETLKKVQEMIDRLVEDKVLVKSMSKYIEKIN